jgi:predicted Zn-dependent peptidase
MNRKDAPEIQIIDKIHTGFPERNGRIFRIDSEEAVFKLEIIYPNAGYGIYKNKFHALYGMDLLLSGTADQSASEISESLDQLGSFVFKNCDYYNASITIYGLSEHLENTLKIVHNSIEKCIYVDNELTVYKNRKISELNINLNKTNFQANRAINDLIFGDNHPYSQKSDEKLIQSIQNSELLEFKKNALTEPYFIYTGPKETTIENTIASFGFDIRGEMPIVIEEKAPVIACSRKLIPVGGSTQNSIRFGKILPSRQDPDYFSLSLMNLVLGGFFGSRLMKNIREEKGLTYGIHSSITPFKKFSLFKISSECNNELSETVKNEIEKEIIQLQTDLISDEELTIARNYMLGSLLRNFDGAFNISERLKAYLELETEQGYYERYFLAINQITPEQIRACANNYLDIKTLNYCVAGEV